MPVRALDFVLQDSKLVREAPLSALKDTRLGIDANLYVRRLLSNPETKEPFVAALGGVPLALEDHITNDMRALEKERIKPIFVFSGLNTPRGPERPLSKSSEDIRPAKRAQAWELYEKGKNDMAMQAFGQVPMTVADVLRVVHRCFLHRKTEFVMAPYLAWAQLVYLERSPKTYVHATWSSTEFLMFEGIDRLILNVDFKRSTFTFVSKRDLLNELVLTTEQFLDVAILAGFENAASIPTPDWSFKSCIDLVKRYNSGNLAVAALAAEGPFSPAMASYPETFARAKTLIKYSLVLAAEEGRVLPLPLAIPAAANMPAEKASDIPLDIHEVFSYRLPDELYFHLFRGLVSPTILGALTSGYWVEQAPLCGGESDEYRRFSKDIMTEHPQSPRCTALGLFTQCLNSFWRHRTVTAIFYFAPDRDVHIPHNSAAVAKTLERLLLWNVPATVIEEELRRQKSSTIDIRLCLGATADDPKWAARTKVAKSPTRPLDKKDEIVANAIWRFLELRGFLGQNHVPTAHGKALYRALHKSRVNDKFQEPLYLAIELIRAGVLHPNKFGGRNWSGGPNLGEESDKTNAMLVMRVLSIVPLTFKSEPWSGPMSRSLLVFNSFLRCLARSLRSLIEATAVNMILRGDAKRQREDFLEIALSLPFARDTNTGMGVIWKGWCDACSHVGTQMGYGPSKDLGGFAVHSQTPVREGDGAKTSDEEIAAASTEKKANLETVKRAVSDMLEDAFGSVRDVRNELARGVRFWDTVMIAVRTLDEEGNSVPPGLTEAFESANKWLEPFRP